MMNVHSELAERVQGLSAGGIGASEAADEMNAAPADDCFKEVWEAFPKALRPGTT